MEIGPAIEVYESSTLKAEYNLLYSKALLRLIKTVRSSASAELERIRG